jgi:hypothetical protein
LPLRRAIIALRSFASQKALAQDDKLIYMAERTFTLQEAQVLLPVLESLLKSAMEAKKTMEQVEAELHQLSNRIFVNGGTLVNIASVARRKLEGEKATQRAKDALAEINAAGVQVKDLDMGLLDFPCAVGGEVILLCWKLGEKTITHWHGSNEGFASRKPVDERITNAKDPKEPN